MKVIFLDIDGVLNNAFSKSKSATGCKGIDDDKLNLLKQIVDGTGAKIVLTSTWKVDWYRGEYDDLPSDGRYMVDKFKEVGLYIFDKTDDVSWSARGKGVLKYLTKFNIEQFCIIDDEMFDFVDCELTPHLVKTVFYSLNGGLNEEHVTQAINILNNLLL